jgi:hypothetical protein
MTTILGNSFHLGICFYSGIPMTLSGHYAFKKGGELCTDNQIIDNFMECKSSVNYLNKRGSNIILKDYDFIGFKKNRPKGCYYESLEGVYWNMHISGKANEKAQPICQGH